MCIKIRHLFFYTGVVVSLFQTSHNPNRQIIGWQLYLLTLTQKRAQFRIQEFASYHWHLLRSYASSVAPSISLCAAVAGMAVMVISLLKGTTQQRKCYAGDNVHISFLKPSGIIDWTWEILKHKSHWKENLQCITCNLVIHRLQK